MQCHEMWPFLDVLFLRMARLEESLMLFWLGERCSCDDLLESQESDCAEREIGKGERD